MPHVPVYQSQISTGPVPNSPGATADDFGARTSEAIVGLTQAGLDLTGSVIQARHAAQSNRGAADATRDVQASVRPDTEDDDPATWPDRVKQRLDAAEAKYRAMGDGAYATAALDAVRSLGPTVVATARRDAARREAALHRDDLTADTDYYTGQAAAASNDLERQSYVNLTKTAIARAHAAGFISKDDALARLRMLPGRIEEELVGALIARDPAAAVAALDDPKRLRNLDPALRDLLRGRATLGRQQARFAAASAVAAGLADGTKSQFDADWLLKDGAIGKATHAWLTSLAEKMAKEQDEKAVGRTRVQGVLDEGGKLDPMKPKDRAAIDAHFDAVVAPGKPDAATLAGYVERTGTVPTALGARLRGGLASDDPEQVVNAASLIGQIGKIGGKLAAGFGAGRLRYAKAVMAGIEGGLSSGRAVELASKRLGQPDAGDDDDVQTAEAEGGTAAGESGKVTETKDRHAADGGTAAIEKGDSDDEAGAGGKADADDMDLELRPEPGGGFGVYFKGSLVGWGQTEEAARDIFERYRDELRKQPIRKFESAKDPGEIWDGGATDRDAPDESRVHRGSSKEREVVGASSDLLDDIGGVASDVGRGLREAPDQILGGAADAVRETFRAFDHLANWLNEHVADLSIDPDSTLGRLGNPLTGIADAMPEVAKARTATGGIVRGISQFLAGFIGGGKIARVLRVPTMVGKTLAAGAFADAVARDPAERNLANLIDEHSELKIPVLEYLLARDDDSEAEARFKKALEGILLGPVSDAAIRPVIKGLGLAVKAIKARRRALRASGHSDEEVVRREQQMLLDARRKVEAEVDQLKKDPAAPIPPAGEVLATLTPHALGEIVVARGRLIRQGGELVVPRSGGEGFTKIVISHPDVTDEDLLALPHVLRERLPAETKPKGTPTQWAWRVRRRDKNGREVEINYVIKRLTGADNKNHLLTVYVEKDPRKFRNASGKVPGRAGP